MTVQPPVGLVLTVEEKALLLRIARESIGSGEGECAAIEATIPEGSTLRESHAVFVTLFLEGRLQGCIGHILADWPLWQAVSRMACQAAFYDPRFEPLSLQHLPSVNIEISVLTPAQPAQSVEEIQVGRDGLIVEGKGRRGLLLPQVASDRNWDVREFLGQTCLKAGLDRHTWERNEVTIHRFQALVFGDKDFH